MSLQRILNAESVAIVGASRSKTKRGYQAIRTLLAEKYTGEIYPVNPKESNILGLRCYKKISDIDRMVDIALITTPARTISPILEECGKKGVKGVVIIAGGFGETGTDGRELERQMVETAHKYGIRIIGPNTSGMMNLKDSLNLVGMRAVPKGDIALLSQSGNMALTLITEAKLKSRKGFSYYVGVGNEADIKFHEYLEFFRRDPETHAILMYVEGMRDGRKFLQQAYKTTKDKPIVILKSGRSVTGRRSAGSHTGALAGMSEVSRGAFQRAGIIVVERSDQLFPVAESLSSLPPMKSKGVAILADGGGHATIAADELTDLDLEIPELSQKTQNKLNKILPAAASVPNPVDVAGGTDSDPSVFADCARIILQDPNVGGLLIVGLFGGYGIRFEESLALIEEDAAHQMGKMVRQYKKPVIVHSLFSSVKPHALDLLRYYGITVYDSLDVACKCMAALSDYGAYLKAYHPKAKFIINTGAKAQKKGQKIIATALSERRDTLLEHEAKALLRLHGAPVMGDVLAQTAEAAVQQAKKIEGDVALKIVSPDILHKSDAGGVRINLGSAQQVKNAFKEIMTNARSYNPDAEVQGVLVSPMSEPGVEVIIGTKIDDQFGPIIMYGLGGIMVEILKDVSFRVLPISPYSARSMIKETQSFPILNGVRGRAVCDQKGLIRLLLIVSEVIEAYPEIQEMDLNPVIVHEKDLDVVDARILLKSGLRFGLT